MDISAILKAVIAPGQDGAPDRLEGLRPGDQLTAKVLQTESDGRLMIDLGRFRALAQTDIQAQPGQTLKLTVEQIGRPMRLRLEPAAPETSTRPLPEIGLNEIFDGPELRKALDAIRRMVRAFGEKTVTLQTRHESGQGQSGTRLQNEGGPRPSGQVSAQPISEGGARPPGQVPAQAVSEGGVKPPGQVVAQPISEGEAKPPGQMVAQPRNENGAPSPGRIVVQPQDEGGTRQAAKGAQSGVGSESISRNSGETGAQARIVPSGRHAAEVSTTSTPGHAMGMTASADQTAGSVGYQAPIQQALVQLGVFLAKPSADASVQQWVDALRVHLSESGHLFEAKLAAMVETSSSVQEKSGGEAVRRIMINDLKPNLLILREALAGNNAQVLAENGAGPKEIEVLKHTVDRMLAHVEHQQERAVQRSGDQDHYQVFAHLLPVKEHPQPVRLKVYYPKKQAGADGRLQHRIALLLDMDRLGPVRADVAMADRMLRIRFFVRDQEVQALFGQHLGEVETALSESFEQVDIAALVSEEKIARFEQEDRTHDPVGRVDLRA